MARYKKHLSYDEYKGREYLWIDPKRWADPKCKTCGGKGVIWIYMATDAEKTQNASWLCGCMRKHVQTTDAATEQEKFDAEVKAKSDAYLEKLTGRATQGGI